MVCINCDVCGVLIPLDGKYYRYNNRYICGLCAQRKKFIEIVKLFPAPPVDIQAQDMEKFTRVNRETEMKEEKQNEKH